MVKNKDRYMPTIAEETANEVMDFMRQEGYLKGKSSKELGRLKKGLNNLIQGAIDTVGMFS